MLAMPTRWANASSVWGVAAVAACTQRQHNARRPLWRRASDAAGTAERVAAGVGGATWRTCPFNIAALATPALLALLWALRGAAPTRPAWAGAVAGLLAGALAVLVYALHCPEMAAPFVAVWYVVGMAIPTALGALLGPRLLRW